MSDVLACGESYNCIEYGKKGIKQCEQCEYSTPKKSMFKPKKKSERKITD